MFGKISNPEDIISISLEVFMKMYPKTKKTAFYLKKLDSFGGWGFVIEYIYKHLTVC